MKKYIFKDYISMYRILGIDKIIRPENLAPFFSFVFCVIIDIFKNNTEDAINSAFTLLMFLPVLMIMMTSNLHPIRLNKMTHIVPLTEKEKYNYVKDLFLFRIALYSVIAIICNLIAVVFGNSTVLAMVINTAEAVLMASVVAPSQNGKKMTYMGLIISGFLGSIFIAAFPNELTGYILSAGIIILVQVPMIFGHINNIKAEFLSAVKYEE